MYTIKVADLLAEFPFSTKELKLIKEHSELFDSLDREYNKEVVKLYDIEYVRARENYNYFRSFHMSTWRMKSLEFRLKTENMTTLYSAKVVNSILSKYKALPLKALVEISEEDHNTLYQLREKPFSSFGVQAEVLKAKEYIANLKLKTLRRKEDGKG